MASGGKVRARLRSDESQDALPYSVMVRRERSRELAQKRRTTYKTIMDDLTQALPFPKDVVSQLDYNSRLRLTLCFFRLKSLLESNTKQETTELESDVTDLESRLKLKVQEGMQLAKQDSKSPRSVPGMLQDMVNEALDGFLMVAMTDGTITYLSESIHKHLGLFQSEHIGISMYELIAEDDHEAVKSAISKAEVTALARMTLNGGADIGFFCRMKCSRFKVTNTVTKNPGYKLVYVSGNLKMSGSDPFLVSVVHPVSPPSILEIRMESNMFVTHYSVDFKCTFFDGRLYNLMGYKKADLLGDVVFTFHHHDDTDATLECSRGIMARGEGLSGYVRFLTRYGYFLWIQTRATLMHDSRTGKPSYIVCLNYVIDKEKGDKALLMRKAVAAKKEDDPVIQEIDSKSHDPFPLIAREDGKVVNPLDECDDNVSSSLKNDQPFSNENHASIDQTTFDSDVSQSESSITPGEVSSSCSDSVGPSSVPVHPSQQNHNTQTPLSVSPEEDCVPDSTTSASFEESGSFQRSSKIGMSRTNTSNSSRSSDTGYSTSDSTSSNKCGNDVFSPMSGYLSGASSLSSISPRVDVTGLQERISSPENPPSVFSTDTSGRSVTTVISDSLSPSSSPDVSQAVQPSSNQFKTAGGSGVHQLGSSVTDTAPGITALLSMETPRVLNGPTPQTFNQATHSNHGLNQRQLTSQMNNTYTINGASSHTVPLGVSEAQANQQVQQGHLLGKRKVDHNPHVKSEYEWSGGLQAPLTQPDYQPSCAFQKVYTKPRSQPGFQGHPPPLLQPGFQGHTPPLLQPGFQGHTPPLLQPGFQGHTPPLSQPGFQGHAQAVSEPGVLGQSEVVHGNGQQHLQQYSQVYSGSDTVQMLPAWNDQSGSIVVKREASDFSHQVNTQGEQASFQPPPLLSFSSAPQQQPFLNSTPQSSAGYQHGNSLHRQTVVYHSGHQDKQNQQEQMRYGQMQGGEMHQSYSHEGQLLQGQMQYGQMQEQPGQVQRGQMQGGQLPKGQVQYGLIQSDQMQGGHVQYRQMQGGQIQNERGQLQDDQGTMFNTPQTHQPAQGQQTSAQGCLPVLTGEDLNVLDYINQVGGNISADIQHMPMYSQYVTKQC